MEPAGHEVTPQSNYGKTAHAIIGRMLEYDMGPCDRSKGGRAVKTTARTPTETKTMMATASRIITGQTKSKDERTLTRQPRNLGI